MIGQQKTGDEPAMYNRVDAYYSSLQFSARYDCVYYLMPFYHLKYDPWEQLTELREFFERQPETSSTFKFRECTAPIVASGHRKGRYLCRLLGSYRLRTGRNVPWVNPTYPQFAELDWTPEMHKAQFYFQLAIWGKWSRTEAAAYFNEARSNPKQLLKRRGINWAEARDWGRERMANTVLITREWEGRSVADMARALNMSVRTLQRWVNNYATLDEIPTRPREQRYSRKWPADS